MRVFEKSSLIRCDIEELFDFHLDGANLKKISPKGIDVEILNAPKIPQEGDCIELKITQFFLSNHWKIKIEKMQRPNTIVDLALQSPFRFFRHSRVFTKLDEDFCELKDVVRYTPPFGILGRMFDFIIRAELASMFAYRHSVTKDILEER